MSYEQHKDKEGKKGRLGKNGLNMKSNPRKERT